MASSKTQNEKQDDMGGHDHLLLQKNQVGAGNYISIKTEDTMQVASIDAKNENKSISKPLEVVKDNHLTLDSELEVVRDNPTLLFAALARLITSILTHFCLLTHNPNTQVVGASRSKSCDSCFCFGAPLSRRLERRQPRH